MTIVVINEPELASILRMALESEPWMNPANTLLPFFDNARPRRLRGWLGLVVPEESERTVQAALVKHCARADMVMPVHAPIVRASSQLAARWPRRKGRTAMSRKKVGTI